MSSIAPMKKLLPMISIALVASSCLAWFLLRTVTVPGKTTSPQPVDVVKSLHTDDIQQVELSPSEIWLYVNTHREADLTELWNRLHITSINISEGQQLDPKKFRFLNRCNHCEAEEFFYELDGEPGHEVIVLVSDESSQSSRHLIFKELDEPVGKWKLLGHVDQILNKYRPAQHSLVATNAGPLLIVTSQGASGSGVQQYGSRLFAVKPDGLKEIMYFVAEGSQAGYFGDPSHHFFGSVVSAELQNGVAVIQLSFSVKYFVPDPSNSRRDLHLLTKTQKAVYTRSFDQSEARLIPDQSEIGERELHDVYQIDSLTNEEFINYNFQALENIAGGNNAPLKEWLKQFLTRCEPGFERESLLRLLN